MRQSNYRVGRPNSLNEDLQTVIALNQNVTGNRVDNLMEKWSPNLKAIKKAFNEKVDDYKLMTTAILLENTNNYLSRQSVPNILNEDATQPSDVSFFKRYAINLLSAVVPNLIAEDIVSVNVLRN
jgi:hypothetical protein